MTERISNAQSGGVCRHPEDEVELLESQSREKIGANERERRVSEAPITWDDVALSCEATSASVAHYAKNAGKGSRTGDTPSTKPRQSAGASTNAARTTERDSLRPYFAAGSTHNAHSVFMGGAATKGTTDGVIEAEAVSLSVQAGLQNEAQAGVARVGVVTDHVSANVETLTLKAHAGIDNADGSIGLNAGVSASFVSSEVTAKYGGNSITIAAGAGAEVGGHIGIRDINKDGRPEFCVRWALGTFSLGGCVESPVVIRP